MPCHAVLFPLGGTPWRLAPQWAMPSRRLHDLAQDPGAVAPADLVVLHRLVCCYPDYVRLLGAPAEHARRALAFSYPPHNLLSRAFYEVFNLVMRLTHSGFRGFAHPPGGMLAVLEDRGLRRTFQRRSGIWQVAGLERVRKAATRRSTRTWPVLSASRRS